MKDDYEPEIYASDGMEREAPSGCFWLIVIVLGFWVVTALGLQLAGCFG